VRSNDPAGTVRVTPSEALGRLRTALPEADPHLALARRAMAEFAGTLLLMLVVVGVGLTTRRGSPTLGVIAEALGVAGAPRRIDHLHSAKYRAAIFNHSLPSCSGCQDCAISIAQLCMSPPKWPGVFVGALTAASNVWGPLGPPSVAPFMKAWTRRERVSSPPPG